MGRYRGKVLYPYVLFKQDKTEVSERLMRHELEHVYQAQEKGVLRFYLSYIVEWLKKGYRDNKYEVAARAVEDTPLTKAERDLFSQGRDSRFWQKIGVFLVLGCVAFIIHSYR